MPLYYDKFSDLALDWPMILVGWRGFAGHKLSAEQVVSHAADLIGRGTPEQDEVAALLANTDSSEWQTIDRYLEQICEGPFDWPLALRKWRLAELKYLLEGLRLPNGSAAEEITKDEEEYEDERYSVFYAISDFWVAHRDELLEGELVLPDFGEPIPQMLAEQQAWVEREEIALHEETGAAT